MRIVQSLWSKPAADFSGYAQYHGRWPHARFFWLSWVISTGWAHKHYGDVELVTDTEGARWLVDKLRLPFTSVRTDLNTLAAPPKLWAAGKIVAYSVQREPFFHIDGDVYLTGKLPARFESAELVCQFVEEPITYPAFARIYDANRLAIERHVPKLPAFWPYMEERAAPNCGIVGGRNIEAFGRYARDVMSMLNDPANAQGWRRMQLHDAVNCVVEQQTLWCSAREQGIAITPLFEPDDFRDDEFFRRKALETHFNHAALEGKNPDFGQHLAERVEAEFPEQFRIISDLFPRKFMELGLPTAIEERSGDGAAASWEITSIEALQIRPPPKKKPKN